MEETNLVFIIVTVVVLLGFSAFFSGSETALMAISRLRMRHLAETRPIRARLVERILEKPEKLIGTILLGNNLVNVAMSALATAFAISIWGGRCINDCHPGICRDHSQGICKILQRTCLFYHSTNSQCNHDYMQSVCCSRDFHQQKAPLSSRC